MDESATPLQKLETICDEIFERWDKDQRAGKLLSALAGRIQNYRADVTEVRTALAGWRTDIENAPKDGTRVLVHSETWEMTFGTPQIATLEGSRLGFRERNDPGRRARRGLQPNPLGAAQAATDHASRP